MAELHLFDFDGTLFRSPHEPDVWDGDWWNNPASLLPPCIPDEPGDEWWIMSTVSDAKRSISDPDVFAIMATGRGIASGLRYRVPELLKQQGLHFDEVYLAPPSGTLAWKKRVITRLLQKHPVIDTVRIWDDRRSHLPEFVGAVLSHGIAPGNVHTTLVHARPQDPECPLAEEVPAVKPREKKPSYVGVFLSAKARAELSHLFPYTFHKAEGGHVTLSRDVTPQWLARVGERVTLRVVGVAEDDQVQAVVVDLPPGLTSDKPVPHVTMSHAEASSPKASDSMLARTPVTPVQGVTIDGVIDVFPRTLVPSASRVAAQWFSQPR